jgi:tape measure domain-containing protein
MAPIIKEASGAGKRGAQAMSSEFEAGGRQAGQKAAAGIAASAKQIERTSAQLASARKAEADAAGQVRVAEARLQEVRNNNSSTASQTARAEESLAKARRNQGSAQAQVTTQSAQLDKLRAGEATTARTVIRAEQELLTARNQAATTAGSQRVAEARLNELRQSGSASTAQIASAEERVAAAKRTHASATDTVRAKEALANAANSEAASSAGKSASANDRAATSARNAGNAYGESAGKVGTFGTSIGSVARRVGTAAGAFIGIGGAIGVVKSGFDRLMNIQRAQIMFKNVGLTADQTKAQMSKLTEQVTGTSVSLADAAKYSAMFSQAGVQLGAPMDNAIKAFTNLSAAAQGTGIDVGRIMQQVAASGRIDAGVLNQLSDAGVNAAAYLSKTTGKSVAEVRKLASEGKISFNDLVTAVNTGMGSYAKEMGETLPAKLANAKTAMASFGASAIEPLIGPLTKVVVWLTSLTKWATKNKSTLMDFAIAATAAGVALGAMSVTANAAAAGGFVKYLTKAVTATRAWAAATWVLNTAMNANALGIIIAAIVALVAAVVIAYKRSETFRNIVQSVWEWIKKAGAAIGGFFVTAFNALKDAVGGVIGFVKRFWQFLILGLGPIGLVINAVVLLIKHWDTVKAVFSATWNVIKSVFSGVGSAFAAAWSVIQGVFSAFMTVLKVLGAVVAAVVLGSILVVWNLLKPAFMGVWTVLQFVFNGIKLGFQAIGALIGLVVNTIILPVWNLLVLGAQTMWAALGVVFGWIKTGFSAVGNLIGLIVNTIIIPIWNLLKLGAQTLWAGLNIIFGWIRMGFSAVGNAIRTVVMAVITPVWNGLRAAANLLWTGLQTVFGWIKNGWNLLGAGIRAVVDNVIKPAWNGLKSALRAVGDFFGRVVDGIGKVWDKLKGFVAKPINFVIGTVWNNGLVKAWNTVRKFLPGLAEAQPLGEVAFKTGGDVPLNSGQRGKDSVRALLMPGEHVWDVMDVVRAGGQKAMFAMRAMIERGIPFTWNAAKGLMSLPSQTLSSLPSAPRNADIKGAFPPGTFPGFETGGAVKASNVAPAWEGQLAEGHKFAKSKDGHPYTWGNEDCSGYMSMIADKILGGSGARKWATSSFPDGQPWKPGLAKGFSVGVHDDPGGPGGGHTAGTLSAVREFATVNVESGGSHGNVAYGGAAVGADNAQFAGKKPGQFHLGIGADGAFESGGGGGGPSRGDQENLIKKKVKEILDKAIDPIKKGMAAAIGAPPPEWLGIPPKVLTTTKDKAVDTAFAVVGALGDKLRSVYNGARKVTSAITGSFKSVGKKLGILRDTGGYLPQGTSIVRNETGKPEAVLNWEQIEKLRKLLESLGKTAGEGILDDTLSFFGLDKLYDAFAPLAEQKGQDGTTAGQDSTSDATTTQGDSAAQAGTSEQTEETTEQATQTPEAQTDTTQGDQAVTDSTSGGAYEEPSYGSGASYETQQTPLTTQMPEQSHEYNPSGGAEQWRSLAKQAMARVGFNANDVAQVNAMIAQIDSESGGDPNIAQQITDVNGSGESAGVGLLQIIPATFAANRDPELPDNRRDPFANMVAALRYYKGRYGMDLTAQWGQGHGYDSGGWLPPGLSVAVNKTGRPEAILSPSQWAYFDDLLESLPSAGQFQAIADVATNLGNGVPHEEEGEGPAGATPLELHNHYHTEDVTEAVRQSTRETRRLAKSNALVGGW